MQAFERAYWRAPEAQALLAEVQAAKDSAPRRTGRRTLAAGKAGRKPMIKAGGEAAGAAQPAEP